jgi:hypothetical protein
VHVSKSAVYAAMIFGFVMELVHIAMRSHRGAPQPTEAPPVVSAGPSEAPPPVVTVCLAALARAAAHTPRTALLRGHHPHDGHPTATLCLLAPDDLVHVPAAHPRAPSTPSPSPSTACTVRPCATYSTAGPPPSPPSATKPPAPPSCPKPRPTTCARPATISPAAWMARVEAALRLDLVTGAVSVHPAAAAARLHATLDPWRTVPPVAHALGLCLGDADAHHAAVETVRAGIRDGAVYLVNVARVLQGAALPEGLVAETMAARFVEADPALGTLCHLGDARVSAMTMERALRWHRGLARADTAPIKGTRPPRPGRPRTRRRPRRRPSPPTPRNAPKTRWPWTFTATTSGASRCPAG